MTARKRTPAPAQDPFGEMTAARKWRKAHGKLGDAEIVAAAREHARGLEASSAGWQEIAGMPDEILVSLLGYVDTAHGAVRKLRPLVALADQAEADTGEPPVTDDHNVAVNGHDEAAAA